MLNRVRAIGKDAVKAFRRLFKRNEPALYKDASGKSLYLTEESRVKGVLKYGKDKAFRRNR